MVAIASGAREDETIRAGIEQWIRAHDAGYEDATVRPLTRPAVGLSSDTCFVTAVTPAGLEQASVVRLPPAGDGLFPEYDLAGQVARQAALRRVGIPTAPARFEPDPAWLGAPFMVMPRVAGEVLANNPSYLRAGWLVDGGVDRQRGVITAFLGTLGTLHRVEPAAIDAAADPLGATVATWCAYLDWAATGGDIPDYLVRARDWCAANIPTPDGPPSVLWGDVQLANCVFRPSGTIAALLDFELTGTGPPELDLGWFLALHDMTVATSGPDLPGFGDRDGMLAAYETALGRPVAPLRWYEVFAMLRSGSIMVRIARILAARGVDDSWLGRGNPTAAALARLLDSEE
jgi:aminoglycoside phosphotransferase (APT) family kinase protein